MDLNPDTEMIDWLVELGVPDTLAALSIRRYASDVARATADAIADQIDAARNPKPVGTGVHADGAFKRAARIARSFGSTAPEGQKP